MARVLDVLDEPIDRGAHLAEMRRDMDALTSWFPTREEWERELSGGPFEACVYRKLPVHSRLVHPYMPENTAIRREAVQRLVDLAPAVAANRPEDCPYAVVVALIEWPSVFHSEICVCFTPETAEFFSPEQYGQPQTPERTTCDDGDWYEAMSLQPTAFEVLGVRLPATVEAGGYATRRYDARLDMIFEEQKWSVRAIAPAAKGDIQ